MLFNCAGVPHPPASALDTVMINFVGLRHLTDTLIPRLKAGGAIASIASTAGMAWKSNLDLVRDFLALETFDKAAAWLEGAPDLKADPYGFSKPKSDRVHAASRGGSGEAGTSDQLHRPVAHPERLYGEVDEGSS